MASKATKTQALAKKASPVDITAIESGIARIMETFAGKLTTLKDDELPAAQTFIDKFSTLTDELRDVLKDRIVSLLKEQGEVATDAGTRRLSLNGYVMEIQPTGNGFDAKKVEALVRAKGLDVESCMDQKVTYIINEGKMKNKLTQAELETCRKTEGWKLMQAKKEE